MSALLNISARAAQIAITQRNLYKAELEELLVRRQIQNMPEEAVIDVRRRDYGEYLTTDVVWQE